MNTQQHRAIFDRYYNYVYSIVYRILRDCGRGAPAGKREHHSVQVVLPRPRSGAMYRNALRLTPSGQSYRKPPLTSEL